MSNHTGKLVMDMWTKFKWWLRFGDFANEEHTKMPISELPAPNTEDTVTKSYIDAQNGQNTPKRATMRAKIEIDGQEATKVLKIITNEANKATAAVKSLTKAQLEAKRALNSENLVSEARNRQNVASCSPNCCKNTQNAQDGVPESPKEGPNCSENPNCDGNCCEKG